MPDTALDDAHLRAVVVGLARSRTGGGHVVERAAILAAGSDCAAIETWILDHAGRPEEAASSHGAGLHSSSLQDARASHRPPRRFLLPPGALDAPQDPPT